MVFGLDKFLWGFFYFIGWCGSYIYFFNNGGIDIRNLIILLVWVYFEKGGFIFYYNLRGLGVSFWIFRRNILYVKFVWCFGCRLFILRV